MRELRARAPTLPIAQMLPADVNQFSILKVSQPWHKEVRQSQEEIRKAFGESVVGIMS